MITIQNMTKWYPSKGGKKVVFKDLNLTIPKGMNIGFLGKNGAGKSTLLRLLGGVDFPNKGSVKRGCRVSWPLGLSSGYQGSMTGRQNAQFVSRIHGFWNTSKVEGFVQEFSELGDSFDEPVKTYSSGMRAKFAFSVSLAFDFDIYLIDEIASVGDPAFKRKCDEIFSKTAKAKQLVMVSHDLSFLKKYCDTAAIVSRGGVQVYENINDAIVQYQRGES